MTQEESNLIVVMLVILGSLVYFVPVFNASKRKHKNQAAIGCLNILLGWTFLGWVIALVWSFTDNVEKPEPTKLQMDLFSQSKSLRDLAVPSADSPFRPTPGSGLNNPKSPAPWDKGATHAHP